MDDAPFPQPAKQRTFSLQFKQDAVRLITDEKYTFEAAAATLGIGEQR